MKYLDFYKEHNISQEGVFDCFISSLKPSIKIWNYFINWDKVNTHLSNIEIELNILNSLIGKEEFEKEFKSLVKKYPNIVKTFPALLAVRESKLEIIKDYQSGKLDCKTISFSKKQDLTDEEIEELYQFLQESQLIQLFQNKKVKNFVDYVLGVEVGLDSNGRKNRGGTLMEEIVEVFVRKMMAENEDLEYIRQATPKKIRAKWGYEVRFEKSARSYDFAIYNNRTKKLFVIETNFFNGGGSKLKAVCGEFKSLFNELQTQGIELIWITDGYGWVSTKRPLEETFNNNNYVFNLDMIEKGVLKGLR